MNLLLAHVSELREDKLFVEGRRALHVHKVLRAKPGQRIRVGIVRESIGEAELMSSSPELAVLGNLSLSPLEAPPRVHLVVALPRPKALRRLLQTAASFGVSHIDLVNAWRVDKSYWGSPLVAPQAMEEELWLGCEQGRHAWLPSLEEHRLLVPYLKTLSTTALRLLAHPVPSDGVPRWLSPADVQAPLVIAIGPEGGWIESELKSFEDAGFQRYQLSTCILRSEIAIASALAQVELLANA